MFIRLLFAYSKSTAAYYNNCRSTFSVANKFMISTTKFNVIPLMVSAMCMAENVQNIRQQLSIYGNNSFG